MSHPYIDPTAVVLGVASGVLILLLVAAIVVYVVRSRREERRDRVERF